MLRKLILAAGIGLALIAPAYAADPQTFGDEAKGNGVLQGWERGLVQPGIEDLLRSRFAVLREDQGRRIHVPGGG